MSKNMASANVQLQEFFVEGGDQLKSHVLLHITEPSNEEEKKWGYFFAVCDISRAESRHIAKLQKIIDDLETLYYGTADTEDKTALELTLQQINPQTVALSDAPLSLNCLVGVIRNQEVIFACHNFPLAFLFYRNKQGFYQKMDLNKESDGAPAAEHARQLFSQVVQGQMTPGDYLLIGTAGVRDYFNDDRLLKIITGRPVRQSAEHLQKVLSELKNGLSFGGLIIKLEDQTLAQAGAVKTNLKSDRPAAPEAPRAGATRPNELFLTEKNTARVLSPSLLAKLNDKLSSRLARTKPEARAGATLIKDYDETMAAPSTSVHHRHPRRAPMPDRERPTPANFINSEKIVRLLRFIGTALVYLAKGLLWCLSTLGKLLLGAGRQLMLLSFVITNYQQRRALIVDGWKRDWRSRQENFLQLPLTTKILITVSVLAALAFVISVFYLKIHQQKVAEQQTYDHAVAALQNQLDSAQSALIYGNENDALTALAEAQNIFNGLNCAKRETACAQWRSTIDSSAQKISKSETVPAELAAELPEDGAGLIKMDNRLLALAANSPALYAVDLLARSVDKLTYQNNGKFAALSAPKENDYALILNQNNELLKYAPGGALTRLSISFPLANPQINHLTVYNRRLYTLDGANSQIYRHSQTVDGFDNGVSWIKNEAVDLSGAAGLAIDGDVYVLKNNGELLRFAQGRPDDFALAPVYPALQTATAVWTYNDVNYLYVLDGPGKRLLIFDKTGKLIKQLTAAEFAAPRGLAVDEPNGLAYILDGNKIYKINLK